MDKGKGPPSIWFGFLRVADVNENCLYIGVAKTFWRLTPGIARLASTLCV